MTARIRIRFFLTIALGLSMALCLGLLFVRYAVTGRFGFRFLAFNLVLAAIPFPVALMVDVLVKHGRTLVALPFLAVWLLFLPNAPYLVTDILHLRPGNVPLWYDALVYGAFAITGMLLCFGSLALVHVAIRNRFGNAVGWMLAFGSLMLSGFGVYLGRIERWNSWSLLQTPTLVAKSVLEPLQNPLGNPHTVGFTLVYGVFLCVGYLAVASIGTVLGDLGTRRNGVSPTA